MKPLVVFSATLRKRPTYTPLGRRRGPAHGYPPPTAPVPARGAGTAAVEGFGKYGRAAHGHHAPHLFLDLLPQDALAAGHLHGRLENAVGKLRQVLGHARDADVAFHLFVIRNHLLVGNGPVVAIAVVRGRFEIQVAHAIALPSPAHAAAAQHALTDPVERLVLRVRILDVVHKPVVVVFRAGVAQPLNGPVLDDLRGPP